MAVIVLVPDDQGVAALSGIDGVRPMRYEPGAALPAGAEHAEVLVPAFLSRPGAMNLAGLPKLRLVQLLTAGAEGWIGALPAGVRLSNARGAHGGSSAEWALAALLFLYRDLGGFAAAKQARHWAYHQTETLAGKRVLVVGAGDLAAELARRLAGFDTTVTLVGTRARGGVRGIDELPGLLGAQDVVILTVPVTTRTRGMVDAKFLAAMADNAILVNVARGPVVDTDALLAELRSGRLRAALDVTDPEPLPPEHPLWDAPNLVLTPHVAGSSTGSLERAWAVARAEVLRFTAGEQPRNLVRGEY
ncbi:phosphoglycerate dehydrogenase [Nocardia brasiliensis]|uniref:Phosphoglycerate dehydrogenase n=1 Tax=Nocardia brasiliensis TaxID=37326 RepID=A0A6G9XV97_NOCBR|nr:NAD(P)-dependent oxidoreductase [Nocardia brasiliensis]QIS04770.1 phosphoglycerate dehydrogenase [Nocardia brasiliensis]